MVSTTTVFAIRTWQAIEVVRSHDHPLRGASSTRLEGFDASCAAALSLSPGEPRCTSAAEQSMADQAYSGEQPTRSATARCSARGSTLHRSDTRRGGVQACRRRRRPARTISLSDLDRLIETLVVRRRVAGQAAEASPIMSLWKALMRLSSATERQGPITTGRMRPAEHD